MLNDLKAPAPKWAHDLVVLLCAAVTLAAFANFVSASLAGFIADSEIWHVTLARNLAEEWYKPWVITRPAFYALLGAFEFFPGTAVGIFLAAKLAMFLNASAIAVLTYRLARALVGKGSLLAEILPWICLTLLFTNVVFLDQGMRIRSDLVSCAFFLFAVERIIVWSDRRGIWPLPVIALPLLGSPKAIFQMFPLIVFARSKRWVLGTLLILSGCASIIVFLYPQSLQYLRRVAETGGALRYSQHFLYVIKTVEVNVLFFSMVALRALTLAYRWQLNLFRDAADKDHQLRFAALCLLSMVTLALSPEPLPFLIAAYLPLFSIFCGLVFDDLSAFLQERRPNLKYFLPGFFVLAIFAVFNNYAKVWEIVKRNHGSQKQLEAISILDGYLGTYPQANYYDVVGLIPQRATIRYFVGPNDPQALAFAEAEVLKHPPNLIFFTSKCGLLGLQFSLLLKQEYFGLGDDIYARWDRVPPTALTRENRLKLYEALKKSSFAVGLKQIGLFHVLLQGKEKNPEKKALRWDELTALEGRGLKVIAFSPFVSPPNLPSGINSLIRYDGLL